MRNYLVPLAGLAGAAAIACGFWWIWSPLGLIAGGVLVLADVILILHSNSKRRSPHDP